MDMYRCVDESQSNNVYSSKSNKKKPEAGVMGYGWMQLAQNKEWR